MIHCMIDDHWQKLTHEFNSFVCTRKESTKKVSFSWMVVLSITIVKCKQNKKNEMEENKKEYWNKVTKSFIRWIVFIRVKCTLRQIDLWKKKWQMICTVFFFVIIWIFCVNSLIPLWAHLKPTDFFFCYCSPSIRQTLFLFCRVRCKLLFEMNSSKWRSDC